MVNNNQNPLGLPKGSVRAILALGIIGTICIVFAKTAQIPDQLLNMGLLILGFYFGQKVATG